jgi:antitoxin component of MazEF toxin-antitoxin module
LAVCVDKRGERQTTIDSRDSAVLEREAIMKSEAKKAMKKVRRVGNSCGIILPKQMLEGVADIDTFVQIVRLGRCIVITPLLEPLEISEQQLKEALKEALQEAEWPRPKIVAVR